MSPKETISQAILDMVDGIDVDIPGKTKSQRQRAVLYRIWEMDKRGHKTFESFYSWWMEKNINDLKEHLNQLTQ